MKQTLSPLERYRQDLKTPGFVADDEQAKAVQELERIYHALQVQRPQETGVMAWVKSKLDKSKPEPVRGLYLWGGVGRGKTHVVNAFHDALPFNNKVRIHFHRFMQRVHAELKTLGGREDPLTLVADRLAHEARVLTFDEFHVSDITDAMLLGRLLQCLFEREVTLVTTSNIHPDGLYKGGLQRARFLPAIELLKQHTTVLELGAGQDHRLRALEQAEIYHAPLDEAAHGALEATFNAVAEEPIEDAEMLEVLGRDIELVRRAEGVAWFEFSALCDGPRGAADYIEIAREFHTVVLEGVPVLGKMDNDRAIRFIMMVDEFYDRSVNLIIAAEAEPEALYVGNKHAFAFERTVSRLVEMRSTEYLRQPHIP